MGSAFANCCSTDVKCQKIEVRLKEKLPDAHLDNIDAPARKALDKYFPGSMSGYDCDSKVGPYLESRGFTKANTLYCDSSCPDEINHNDPLEDITSIF